MSDEETSVLFSALKLLTKDSRDSAEALSWQRNKCPSYTIALTNAEGASMTAFYTACP